jgi:hypothetical protein
MIYLLLKGGLGNQLFQIFTSISYSMREKQNFMLPFLPFSKRKSIYWDTVFINLKNNSNIIDNNIFKDIKYDKKYEEINFSYNEIISLNNNNSNLLLNGYFQSYKYFINDYKYIYDFLNLNNLKNSLEPIYNNLITNQNKTISIHFRLGDYKDLKNTHPILPYEYYYKSLKYLINPNENYNVLYFCEEVDKDVVEFIIFKLKKQFVNIEFIQCPFDIEDWKQMFLMSLCNKHIIANSTFSWWGAHFNNREKIVCYPSIWFGKDLLHYHVKDLFPNDWIEIKI